MNNNDEDDEPKVTKFSISYNNAIRLGLLHLMRETATYMISAFWYYLVFRYVLRIEVEAWPFIVIVFFGNWITDSIQTAIDSSVERDTKKIVTVLDREKMVCSVKDKQENENDDGSD